MNYYDYMNDLAEDYKIHNDEFYCNDDEMYDPFEVWCEPAEYLPAMADAWEEKNLDA